MRSFKKNYFIIIIAINILYNIEHSIGFETNNNANRKYKKYHSIEQELSSKYHKIKFFNSSTSFLGNFGDSCDKYIQLHKDLDFQNKHLKFILMKLMTIIIVTIFL